jgi:hypothetical protein
MAIRKDAKADIKDSAPAAEQSERATGPSVTRQDAAFPAVQPSTAVNIALHSLLMVTVPFALFFTAHFGGLDCRLHVLELLYSPRRQHRAHSE